LRLLRVLLVVLIFLAFASAIAPAHAQSCGNPSQYYVASLNGNIDPGAADFLSTAVATAEASCDGTFVFILNTNGGDGASMESMVGSIGSYQSWGGTFITLVAPPYSHAWSAGAYIAEASNKIIMSNGTSIGAATPIVSGIPVGEENSTMSKDIGAFSAYMGALASSNGRNGYNAELMVIPPAQTYNESLALQLGVVNGIVQASTVQGALTELGVPAPMQQINTPGIRSTLISILSDPNVSGLLFLVGVFAVLADLYHPTLILSIAGVVVIALSLFGLGLFGASPLAIFLMIIGAAFVFLEIKTQHGVSAVIGVIIFIVGFLLVFQYPASAPSAPQNLQGSPANFIGISDITYGLIAALGLAIVLGSLYLRSIRQGLINRPKVNEPSMTIGKGGIMQTDAPVGGNGVALVGAEQWSVVSSQELKKGDAIKVKEVKGNKLIVEKQ
jgi:membrane-bound serine protease (ClpP class)